MSETQTVHRPDSQNDIAIQLENVSVRYRVPHERYTTLKEHAIRWLQRRVQYDDFWALHDVNLNVRHGQVVGIIGRNGAGKSTLLKVIARVLRPTRGRVRLRGQVAPLLEFGAGFHPELTGRENVFLNGTLLGFSRAEMTEKFPRIVKFAELENFIDAPLRTFSSGMVARLGFAVATDVSPDILILDEVLSVGDAAFQIKSAERIQSFRAGGSTILMVSHNLGTVQAMCDYVYWLDQGRVVAEGPADLVVHQYLGRDVAREAERLEQEGNHTTEPRSGSRPIEITAVRLLNSKHQGQTIFQTNDQMILEMDYRCHHSVPSPVFGMAIFRQDGTHVTGPNTDFAGLALSKLNGSGTITYTVPELPLLEGLYHITVAVRNHQDTEIFDYRDRCYSFRVLNEGAKVREQYGLITLKGKWELDASE